MREDLQARLDEATTEWVVFGDTEGVTGMSADGDFSRTVDAEILDLARRTSWTGDRDPDYPFGAGWVRLFEEAAARLKAANAAREEWLYGTR